MLGSTNPDQTGFLEELDYFSLDMLSSSVYDGILKFSTVQDVLTSGLKWVTLKDNFSGRKI